MTNICTVCGVPGAPCCPGSACDADGYYNFDPDFDLDGTTCNANSICETTCGGPGLPCCPDSSGEARGCFGLPVVTTCQSGVCEVCGGLNQPCCDTARGSRPCFGGFNSPTQCDAVSNTCVPVTCGEAGLSCCDAGERDDVDECSSYGQTFCDTATDTCTRCGYDGLDCCPELYPGSPYQCLPPIFTGPSGGDCSAENVCTNSRPLPPPVPPAPEPTPRVGAP